MGMDISKELGKKEITKHHLRGHRCMECKWARISLTNECLKCLKHGRFVDIDEVCSCWEVGVEPKSIEAFRNCLKLAFGEEDYEKKLSHNYKMKSRKRY